MNGRMAKQIRAHSSSREHYRALKREHLAAIRRQHPNALPERKHPPKEPARPSWPATANQRRQSRPLIMIHPVRQAVLQSPHFMREVVRANLIGLDKHQIDAAARA